jgi:inhibitor of cysteine peptidase
MLHEEFKKELHTIQADPDLLSKTRHKIALTKMQAARSEPTRPQRNRSSGRGMRIAVAILCPLLILSGGLYYMITRNPSVAQIDLSPSNAIVIETTVSPSLILEDASFEGFSDPEIHNFTNYASIMSFMNKSQGNASRDTGIYDFFDVLETKADAEVSPDNEGLAPDAPMPTEDNQQYSETNVQVQGVDEADIIKNDGEYIFYISGTNLHIVDVRNPKDMKTIAVLHCDNIEIYEYFLDIFYDSETHTLSVILSSYSLYSAMIKSDIAPGGCYPSQSFTTLATYDVSDPSSPEPIVTFSQEGSYISSRRIGDTVYLITSEYVWYESGIRAEELLPCTSADGNTWKTVPAQDIYFVNPEYANTYTIVSAIDTRDEDDKASTQVVVGSGNTVYCSLDTLYIAGLIWEPVVYDTFTEDIGLDSPVSSEDTYRTKILSFSITDGTLAAKATGTVQGMLLNQYAMDEYEGYLRVATTTGGWTSDTSNQVIVLDDYLDEVSALKDLAPGEKIYAVRFVGDRIYLVTFVQVDPFFVIDASDPTDLKVLGELKIPGYSNYLQMLGDNKVLAIGNATRTEGSSVIPTGLKIAIFDVTDPENPVVQSSLVYGTSYGYSEVQYNPKALMLDLNRGFIGMPVSFDKPSGAYGSEYVDGFLLLTIDEDGNLKHRNIFDSTLFGYGGSRGVYIDNTLFLVGYSEIASFSLVDFDLLDSLTLDTSYAGPAIEETYLPD